VVSHLTEWSSCNFEMTSSQSESSKKWYFLWNSGKISLYTGWLSVRLIPAENHKFFVNNWKVGKGKAVTRLPWFCAKLSLGKPCPAGEWPCQCRCRGLDSVAATPREPTGPRSGWTHRVRVVIGRATHWSSVS